MSTGSGTAIGAQIAIHQGSHLPEISSEWLDTRAREALRYLEPRYHPSLSVDVPLARAMKGFARQESALSPFRHNLRRLQVEFDTVSGLLADSDTGRAAGERLAGLRREVDATPGPGVLPVASWQEECDHLWTAVEQLSLTLDTGARDDAADRARDTLSECWSLLDEATRWLDGEVPAAWNRPVVVISGEAGRGKSHLLADTLTAALAQGQPAVLLLGHTFLSIGDPWAQIRALVDWPGTTDELLAALDERGRTCGRRVLLMVDALNEGQGRLIWPAHLAGFLARAARFDSIGVAVSVRTVALDVCVSAAVRDSALMVVHDGFAGVEHDAVRAFLRYYGLVGPATPLLLPEFREPLFLDLYCRTAQLRPALLTGATPGLSGVLTEFLAAMDEVVRRAFDTDPIDRVVVTACMRLAGAMHHSGRRWLSRDEAKDITRHMHESGTAHSRSLLAALINERVIVEDVVATTQPTSNLVPVVRFAYERLADQLIAQTLIDGTRQPGGYDQDALATIVASLQLDG